MSKQHDISGGIDFSGGQLETAKIIFFSVLGWFSITIEAFMRYNFGERYYTKGNFFVGFWVLNFFILGSAFFGALTDVSFTWGTIALYKAYLWFSLYHFWKIWVNNQVGDPQHSLYGGTSRIMFLGRIMVKLLNPVFAVIARFLGRISLTPRNFKRLDESLNLAPPIRDVEGFTKKWLEPLVVWLIAFLVLPPGAISLWLFVSGLALLIHSHMGYEVARDQELDVSDSIIDAAFQKEDVEGQKVMRRQMHEALKTVEQRIENEPEYVEELKENNPSVLDALADLDLNLQTLGKQE